jgi:hypothetical protein
VNTTPRALLDIFLFFLLTAFAAQSKKQKFEEIDVER